MRLAAVGAIVAGLAMAACSAAYVEDSQATVLLVVQSINSGTPILSDVRVGDTGSIANCQVTAGLTSLVKNPTNPGNPNETVLLQRYDVSFVRSDGRAVEGVDVPYRFSEAMSASLAPGDAITVPIDLVRHQAYLEQPLSEIIGGTILEVTANVTFYGETISRHTVSASGAASIRFADYATGTTTCNSGK